MTCAPFSSRGRRGDAAGRRLKPSSARLPRARVGPLAPSVPGTPPGEPGAGTAVGALSARAAYSWHQKCLHGVTKSTGAAREPAFEAGRGEAEPPADAP